MTSGTDSCGGKQFFSISVGGSLYKLSRQVCRILDLTMGLRLGRRLLEETHRGFWISSHSPLSWE